MKSIVCLIAMVCAASLVLAGHEEELPFKGVKLYKENESGPIKSHTEVVTELNAKKLSPEEVVYLVTSTRDSETIVGYNQWYHIAEISHVFDTMTCTNFGLAVKEEECVMLAELKDDPVLYDNLEGYCQADVEKVKEYCSDKMVDEFDQDQVEE